jgi:hypothetical protein
MTGQLPTSYLRVVFASQVRYIVETMFYLRVKDESFCVTKMKFGPWYLLVTSETWDGRREVAIVIEIAPTR